MSDAPRVALPQAFLPAYRCPTCGVPLRYDAQTDPETHETGARCDSCGRAWIVTASATSSHPDTFQPGGFSFTMRDA